MGTLTMSNDDPDSSSKSVMLTGQVLEHAEASLDSLQALTGVTLDFGAHTEGTFSDTTVRVHNLGYDAFQARLAVNGAVITGGDGRFSLVGGFKSALLGAVGKSYVVRFDETGATRDSSYKATLTFASSDEPIPGAASAADLVVTLRARPVTTVVGAPDTPLPAATRLLAPRPNPMRDETSIRFDLAARAPLSLALYDLSGRLVRELASGLYEAGRHEIQWRAQDGTDSVRPGLYFLRLKAPGINQVQRLIAMP